MKYLITGVCLLTYGAVVYADIPHFDKSRGVNDDMNVVGVACDLKNDVLELGFFTGDSAPDGGMELWDTFNLKTNKEDADVVESVLEIERTCNIGGHRYVVTVRGVPGNWNLNGECGALTFAGARITKDGETIFNENFQESCSGEVISKVVVSSQNAKPIVTRVPYKQFYGLD